MEVEPRGQCKWRKAKEEEAFLLLGLWCRHLTKFLHL